MKNAKIHLSLIVFGALFFGMGLGAEFWGIRGGLSFWPCITLYIFGILFWLIVAFTSLQKVKNALGVGTKLNEKKH